MCSEMRHCNLLQFYYRNICNALVDEDRSATDKRDSFLERYFHKVVGQRRQRLPLRILIVAQVFLKCYLNLEICPDLICWLQHIIVDS
jgi:hypothetical protein